MRGRNLLAAVLLPAVFASGCDEVEAGRVEIGGPAPAYGAVDLAGDSVHLTQLRGDVVLLNVWATWCAPCREEIPALQALFERHGADGLEIVGVSIDGRNEGENIRAFAEEFGVTFRIWHDPEDRIGARFRTVGVPTTFLLDREGVIRWRHMGPVTEDDPSLEAVLAAALAAE